MSFYLVVTSVDAKIKTVIVIGLVWFGFMAYQPL